MSVAAWRIPACRCMAGWAISRKPGAAQYLRDARITPIYEGTNGIQAMDLVGRKLADGGDAAMRLLDEILDNAKAANGAHHDLSERVWQAGETMREATLAMMERDLPERFGGAVPFLMAFARVLGAHYHLRAAMAGSAAHVALARVYISRVLPALCLGSGRGAGRVGGTDRDQ